MTDDTQIKFAKGSKIDMVDSMGGRSACRVIGHQPFYSYADPTKLICMYHVVKFDDSPNGRGLCCPPSTLVERLAA